MYALTKVKGVGRRYSNLVCKKADVDLNKRYDFVPFFSTLILLGVGRDEVSSSNDGGKMETTRRVVRLSLFATIYIETNNDTDGIFLFLYRAGDLTSEELERIVTILQNPTNYRIPSWFLNRQRDITDGKDSQLVANGVDSKLRDDLERLKKIRAHRGLRHYWGLRVRGQHTKTTGRRGRTVGVSKKKN